MLIDHSHAQLAQPDVDVAYGSLGIGIQRCFRARTTATAAEVARAELKAAFAGGRS